MIASAMNFFDCAVKLARFCLSAPYEDLQETVLYRIEYDPETKEIILIQKDAS